MLSHAQELLSQLQEMGITATKEEAEPDDEWEDVEGSEEDEDVNMET